MHVSFEWKGKTYTGELIQFSRNGVPIYQIVVNQKRYEFLYDGGWQTSRYLHKTKLPADFVKIITEAIDKSLEANKKP